MKEEQRDAPEQASKPERKPYAPPRIEESGSYEQLVLGCGLAGGTECIAMGGERSMM